MPRNYVKLLINFFFFFVFLIVTLAACSSKAEKRVYEEIVIESPLKAAWQGAGDPHASLKNTMAGVSMPDVLPELLSSSAALPLTWTTPEGWQEFPGSGFRLVTFKAGEGEEAIETSIVSLSGEAGGIEANLIRWMQQINLEIPANTSVIEFLEKKSAFAPSFVGSMPMDLVDFTALQKNLPNTTASIYAHIIKTPQATIFIKMTGNISAIKRHQKEFISFIYSIRLKNNE